MISSRAQRSISVPDTGGRYYSLMLEDAYTNVFGYIGSRATGSGAGQYLIAGPGLDRARRPPEQSASTRRRRSSRVIGRTLIDGEKDMPNVAAIQRQYTVAMIPPVLDAVPAKQRWDIALQPKLVPVQQVDTLDWKTYYRWAGQLMKDNPPPRFRQRADEPVRGDRPQRPRTGSTPIISRRPR